MLLIFCPTIVLFQEFPSFCVCLFLCGMFVVICLLAAGFLCSILFVLSQYYSPDYASTFLDKIDNYQIS